MPNHNNDYKNNKFTTKDLVLMLREDVLDMRDKLDEFISDTLKEQGNLKAKIAAIAGTISIGVTLAFRYIFKP